MEQLSSNLLQCFHEYRQVSVDSDRQYEIINFCQQLQNAFYTTPTTKKSNKFIELENILKDVFCMMHTIQHEDLWLFMIDVILQLLKKTNKTLTFVANSIGNSDSINESIAMKKLIKKKSKKDFKSSVPLVLCITKALQQIQPEDNNEGTICMELSQNHIALQVFVSSSLKNIESVDLKLLVELLYLFHMTYLDAESIKGVCNKLLENRAHSAVIKLCTTYNNIDWEYASIIQSMIQSKDWLCAELIAKKFTMAGEKRLETVLVEEALAINDYKRAHRYVNDFELHQDFPDIDALLQKEFLMKLIEERRWDIAASFVTNSRLLQSILLHHLTIAGELQYQQHLKNHFGFPDVMPVPTSDVNNNLPESIASINSLHQVNCAQEKSDYVLSTPKYLEFPLSQNKIHFYDTQAQIEQLYCSLFNTKQEGEMDSLHIIGLDVEWKPIDSKNSGQPIASILQIAYQSNVYVIDLLALHNNEFLMNKLLQALMTAPNFVKVGFGFASDMKVLQETFPERTVFHSISPFIDLLWDTRLQKNSRSMGLSSLVQYYLGKKLDKTMQMSNWDQRPLSKCQLEYAALDAYVLTQVLELRCSQASEGKLAFLMQEQSCLRMNPLAPEDVATGICNREQYIQSWSVKSSVDTNESLLCDMVDPTENKNLQRILCCWQRYLKHREHISGKTYGNGENSDIKFIPFNSIDTHLKFSEQSYHVVNSICFYADGRPAVACISSKRKINIAVLAKVCQVSRRSISLASKQQCEQEFGFSPGSIPPFGHYSKSSTEHNNCEIKIYTDASLMNYKFLISGGGAPNTALCMPSRIFFQIVPMQILDHISIFSDKIKAEIVTHEVHSIVTTENLALPSTAPAYKFLVDDMLLRLGRWLRAIGIDVEMWKPSKHIAGNRESDTPTSKLELNRAMLDFASRENRIVLTRDKNVGARRGSGACFLVQSERPYFQFHEVVKHFSLQFSLDKMMSRCTRCNGTTFKTVDIDKLAESVNNIQNSSNNSTITKAIPKKVAKYLSQAKHATGDCVDYWSCVVCNKIYWKGSKYKYLTKIYRRQIEKIDEQGDSSDAQKELIDLYRRFKAFQYHRQGLS